MKGYYNVKKAFQSNKAPLVEEHFGQAVAFYKEAAEVFPEDDEYHVCAYISQLHTWVSSQVHCPFRSLFCARVLEMLVGLHVALRQDPPGDPAHDRTRQTSRSGE